VYFYVPPSRAASQALAENYVLLPLDEDKSILARFDTGKKRELNEGAPSETTLQLRT